MREAWIIDAARTPRGIGKHGKGALWEVHPQKLLSSVLKPLADRNNLNTDEIDDEDDNFDDEDTTDIEDHEGGPRGRIVKHVANEDGWMVSVQLAIEPLHSSTKK